MKLSVPIFKLKREAKIDARARNIPLHAALDEIATQKGFRNWSHLATREIKQPIAKLMNDLVAGELVLLGARPGQGKTMLALQMLMHAVRTGKRGYFYTLEYTELDVLSRLKELRCNVSEFSRCVEMDTSDKICAAHIVDAISKSPKPGFVVIDYLQLLDQRRENEDLKLQVERLAKAARETGSVILAISQIDRDFEFSQKRMPDLSDIRLPNPVNLGHFSKAWFLHNGALELAKTV